MIHKGRAFTYLKEFDKALEEFENVKKADQKQAEIANGIKTVLKLIAFNDDSNFEK